MMYKFIINVRKNIHQNIGHFLYVMFPGECLFPMWFTPAFSLSYSRLVILEGSSLHLPKLILNLFKI
jgi:hypothetical protein